MWDILSAYNLPRAGGYEEDSVILGDRVFHPILYRAQYTLLDLEVFILLKMYMSVIPANQIRSVTIRI